MSPSVVIVREGGRSSIPETPVIEPKGRSVLDTPPARGTTVEVASSARAKFHHFIMRPVQSPDPVPFLLSIPTSRETNSMPLRSCVDPPIITPNNSKEA
jgi:hypothetical protein